MVKKKDKITKHHGKKDHVRKREDVKVNTGLPPKVEGQLRCFCCLSVNQIKWMCPSPPDVTNVRVRWWGEEGDGAIFKPYDARKGNKLTAKTCARYPIKSGPKQFSAYLSDMSSLLVEVLSGNMMVPVGYAEVTDVEALSPITPIHGFYPVISPNEDRIAELEISLMLETVSDSCDSIGNSIPTTDISMETQESSMYPQRMQHQPHSIAPIKPTDDPFISPASHQNGYGSAHNGYANTAADLRQQLNYSLYDNQQQSHLRPVESVSSVEVTANGDVVTSHLDHSHLDFISSNPFHSAISAKTTSPSHTRHRKTSPKKSKSPERPVMVNGEQKAVGGDLLSILLDRGDKLRKEMIISSIEDCATGQSGKKDSSHVITQFANKEMDLSRLNESRQSNGSLFKEILKTDKGYINGHVNTSDLEENTVDLVVGHDMLDNYQMLKNVNGSPGSSVSGDIDLASDPGDPIHNESLLKELFYKNPESEVSELSEFSEDEHRHRAERRLKSLSPAPSVDDPANARPPSRRSSISSVTLPVPESADKKVEKIKTPKRKARLKVKKRKGSKKRRHSKSRSSASEMSDSDFISTPRSEMSQVSFDMPPSDIDEPEQANHKRRKRKVDGLSIERLTLLGRVHVARVTIEELKLAGNEPLSTPTKKKPKSKSVGKPPKPSPKCKKPVTYFIEYQFPVVATSRDKQAPNTMATEVMRVASKNIKDGLVTFSHRSVFPIMFDGTAVDKWWKSALVFKIFSRSAGQKVPTQIGSCGVPLKSILKSDMLQLDCSLEVRENFVNRSICSLRGSDTEGLYGQLKVSIELASDNKEFSSALAKTKLAEMSGQAKIVPIPKPPPPKSLLPQQPSAVNTQNIQNQVLQMDSLRKQTESNLKSDIVNEVENLISRNSNLKTTTEAEIHHRQYENGMLHIPVSYGEPEIPEVLTLHTLLLIPEGRNITMNGIPCLTAIKRHPIFPPQPHSISTDKSSHCPQRNTYLVCRMFWCDDAVHSDVCWSTAQPVYNFTQVAPVLVSQSLLERMRNNFMIVEVWDKKTTAENDKLIGIVKLSLHQFYMSFRERKISTALLKSQYPVISVDNYLPIVDPLSGAQFGQIKVLLAMGSADQVSTLQRMKMENSAELILQRPHHHLPSKVLPGQEYSPHSQLGAEILVEHIFEIVIEGIQGLSMFENMMWGEADCFVQYHFPTQTQTDVPGAPAIRHGIPRMKSYSSATTLCIPDPSFNDVHRHRLLLPQGTPVQRELLTACAGFGNSGGISFEVWCRYYHPNVRDQCIAKTSLPLAKLCAMVTMKKRSEPSVQSFSLPIKPVSTDMEETDSESKAKLKECGLMTVTVNYKTHIAHNESTSAVHRNIGQSQVCLSVGIIRASGIKAAAEMIANWDSGMQYPAEVGVNAYVKVQLSFLGKSDERITRTVARSFAPEFSHTMDFPCHLIWTEADNEALSFAEILERGQLNLQLWHQVPGLASDIDRRILVDDEQNDGRKVGDVLLGTTSVSLSCLLTHRTGINGWFAVTAPPRNSFDVNESMDASGHHGNSLERIVGGFEVEVKFAHHNDREKVIHAGRGVGWSPVDLQVEDNEEWMSDEESTDRFYSVSVVVDQANFPLSNALRTGQNTLDKGARCYVRYKVYDRVAVMSKVTKMADSDGILTSELGHKHTLQIPSTSPFRWYLREERLEIQVWVNYSATQNKRPQHRDKLIGSAYIDMEALADQRRKQHRVSGLYPLFKSGAANLGGGFIRAHVTLKPQFGTADQRDKEFSMASDVEEEYDPNDSFHQISSHSKPVKSRHNQSQLEHVQEEVMSSFSVMISVERAMHLPHVSEKNRSGEHMPNTYVSYQTSESTDPTLTVVFPNSDNPVWDHQHETKLSTDLLMQEDKNLVFKVWHKPNTSNGHPDKSTDRVLGFVSVDLTPLASGLQQICGWYNIADFNGQCRGQIKVNIIPQECLSLYRQISDSHNQPISLPIRVESSIHNPPIWFPDPPLSLPVNTKPFSSNLPQFDQQVAGDLQNQHLLQQQLVENIKLFLDRQQTNPESKPELTNLDNEPSVHWVPRMPDFNIPESCDNSRSVLFTSLRKQMQDLDQVTTKLKQKLSPAFTPPQTQRSESDPPISCRSTGHATLTSTQSGLSTISTLHLNSHRENTATQESELLLTASNEAESSRTCVDSGVLSVTHSSEKYNEALDSQRSDGLDAFKFGLITQGLTKDSPRDHNNSDTGIHCAYNSHEDNSSANSNMGNTPREIVSKNGTPRGNGSHSSGSTPRDPYSVSNGSKMSDPSSLGFLYQSDLSSRSQVSCKNGFNDSYGKNRVDIQLGIVNENNSNDNFNSVSSENKKSHVKDMSIIDENAEESGGEGDEKYYHRYRDILDEQESDVSEAESEANVVVPRTLNDISGKFGGIPGQELLNGHRELPKEFHQSDHTMPFDVKSDSRSGSKSNSGSKKTSEAELSDSDDACRTEQLQDSKCDRHQFYVEKDSWFSDEEVELQKSNYDPSFGPGSRSDLRDVCANNSSRDMVEKDSWFSEDDIHLSLQPECNQHLSANHRNPKHLLSKVKLDTITSVGSQEYTEERDLLNNVDLDSVTSGTNTQKGDSVRNSTNSFIAKTVYENDDELSQHEHDQVPKSPKEVYNDVVVELEDFFMQSNTQEQHKETELKSSTQEDIEQNIENGALSNRSEEGENSIMFDFHDKNSSTSETESKTNEQQLPNFFLPINQLQESMKVLQLATNSLPASSPSSGSDDAERMAEKVEAAAEMKSKLHDPKVRFVNGTVKTRQLPTADEAKRIAKIFSSRVS